MIYNNIMTDKKWGGKREGAGRPKGTNNKKQYCFRLSEEELNAVRELLAKMRGKLVVLFCLLSLCLPSYAAINGSVEYTESNAKQEAFQGVYKFCPFPNMLSYERTYKLFIQNDDVLEIQEFNTKIGLLKMKVLGVIYKDMPNRMYYYERTKQGDKCVMVEDFEKPISNPNIQHERSVKYDAKTGKLMSVAIYVDQNESYIYDSDQKLVNHWIGTKAYPQNKKLKADRKIIYSAQ